MTERDPFSLLAEQNGRARSALRRTLGEYTGGLLLTACLLLTAVLPLVVLRLVNPFSASFLLRTAYAALTSTLSYLVFLPEGRRAEEKRDASFAETEERLSRLSRFVRLGHLASFSLYCREAAERECEERREALLAAAEAEPRRARRLRRRARRLRPCPISPALVLCREGRGEVNSVGRRGGTGLCRAALLRPLFVLLSSLLFSSVMVLPGEALDTSTAVQILSGLFGVTMAAFAGFSAGGAQAKSLLGMTERRILFLSSFCEEKGLNEGASLL